MDFLTKKKKINEGEIPQYYVENSHPAIVSPEAYALVQHEMKRRKSLKGYKTSGGCFSSKLICGECGNFYGSKVWHSTSKYRRTIWQCNHKFKNEQKCQTPHINEETIQVAFIDAFNSLIANKAEILTNYKAIIQSLTDTTTLDKKAELLQGEYEVVTELLRKCVDDNAHQAQDQAEYQKRYSGLVERYDNVKREMSEIDEARLDRNAKREKIEVFLRTLEESECLISEFDDNLWLGTVESVTIHSYHDLVFTFKDGMKLNWTI